jgi:hypothetical protein
MKILSVGGRAGYVTDGRASMDLKYNRMEMELILPRYEPNAPVCFHFTQQFTCCVISSKGPAATIILGTFKQGTYSP